MSLVRSGGAPSGGTAVRGVRVQLVAPAELGRSEVERWRALRAAHAAAGGTASPFMAPEFTLATGRARPAARVAVLWRDGEAVGFFPFERGPLGRGRAIGLGVSDCQGAILAPGVEAEITARELLSACALSTWEFDNLEDGQTLFAASVTEEFDSPVMDLADGFAAYEERLLKRSPKFLKSTRAKERRLSRRVGDLRFVFDERDPAMLRTLMEWKSAQYRRTHRGDRFATDWIAGLVHDLHAGRDADCSGVLSVLYAGGQPVSAHFGLRSRTVLACWFPAYDTRFARYSPGLVLHLRMAEAAAAAGVTTFDLGQGPAVYKDAFKTGELRVFAGAATRPGPGAVVSWLSREPSRLAHGYVRARPRLAGFAQRTLVRVAKLRGH
ncbi:GNAT family N-acetyltransferase [Streptomyces sp. NPDC017979]|uniref:GNAT family N-acetyltransferase n=1 Tax=Streptomyces sp. NPDC017979 TaxID=3365024 RepID=UPI003787E586